MQWIFSIQLASTDSSFCGTSLISFFVCVCIFYLGDLFITERYILTAAHVFINNKIINLIFSISYFYDDLKNTALKC